jgi:hypothetical protein
LHGIQSVNVLQSIQCWVDPHLSILRSQISPSVFHHHQAAETAAVRNCAALCANGFPPLKSPTRCTVAEVPCGWEPEPTLRSHQLERGKCSCYGWACCRQTPRMSLAWLRNGSEGLPCDPAAWYGRRSSNEGRSQLLTSCGTQPCHQPCRSSRARWRPG